MNRIRCLWLAGCCLAAAPVAGEEVLQHVSWSDADRPAAGLDGHLVLEDGETYLRVESEAVLRTLTVLRLQEPAIGRPDYALAGEVRYEGVAGEGFLEMWSYFADGQAYFSRTLSARGLLQSLRGSSDWRPFLLPFSKGGLPAPEKLVVNVVLPSGGRVDLRNVRLVEYEEAEGALPPAFVRTRGAWWGPRAGGLVGGFLGTLSGLLFALAAYLVAAGRAPWVTAGVLAALHVLGAVSLLLGVVALALRQPYAVYYPCVLTGLLVLPLSFLLRWRRHAVQRARELRRVQALDAG